MIIVSFSCAMFFFFFFNDTATTEIYTLSLHDALPISRRRRSRGRADRTLLRVRLGSVRSGCARAPSRSEEHTSELQSRLHLVCRLLLEKKKHDATQSISAILPCATPSADSRASHTPTV